MSRHLLCRLLSNLIFVWCSCILRYIYYRSRDSFRTSSQTTIFSYSYKFQTKQHFWVIVHYKSPCIRMFPKLLFAFLLLYISKKNCCRLFDCIHSDALQASAFLAVVQDILWFTFYFLLFLIYFGIRHLKIWPFNPRFLKILTLWISMIYFT